MENTKTQTLDSLKLELVHKVKDLRKEVLWGILEACRYSFNFYQGRTRTSNFKRQLISATGFKVTGAWSMLNGCYDVRPLPHKIILRSLLEDLSSKGVYAISVFKEIHISGEHHDPSFFEQYSSGDLSDLLVRIKPLILGDSLDNLKDFARMEYAIASFLSGEKIITDYIERLLPSIETLEEARELIDTIELIQ